MRLWIIPYMDPLLSLLMVVTNQYGSFEAVWVERVHSINHSK